VEPPTADVLTPATATARPSARGTIAGVPAPPSNVNSTAGVHDPASIVAMSHSRLGQAMSISMTLPSTTTVPRGLTSSWDRGWCSGPTGLPVSGSHSCVVVW
jgi:hypothetical protein